MSRPKTGTTVLCEPNFQEKCRGTDAAPWPSTGLNSYRKNPSVWTQCLGEIPIAPPKRCRKVKFNSKTVISFNKFLLFSILGISLRISLEIKRPFLAPGPGSRTDDRGRMVHEAHALGLSSVQRWMSFDWRFSVSENCRDGSSYQISYTIWRPTTYLIICSYVSMGYN